MVWSPPSPLPAPITTARTVVRQYQRGDGPMLFEAINASRDRLFPFLPWAKTEHLHVDDSVYFVEKTRREVTAASCVNVAFAVLDSDQSSILGGVGFHRIDVNQSCGEIGYWMRGDRHGEGLCTEFVSRVMTSGFTPIDAGGWGFRRITLLCAAKNIGSRRVAEKLGLRLERRERDERFQDEPSSGYYDLLGFAALAEEWDSELHRARPGIAWPSFADLDQ